MYLRKVIASLMAATMALTPSVAVFAQTRDEPLNLNLPTMGSVAGTDLSPMDEQMLGEEIMSQIRADASYLNDAETLDYFNHLGYRLVSVSKSHSYNFFFFPIIDKSLNAFAMPGGFIAVHTGLVVAAQNESELAGVVGHEIGHVSQRHIARMIDQQRHSAALTIGSLLLALLAARAGGGQAATAVAMGSQAAMIQNQLGFSRSAEREADRIGLTSLVNAGFDPKGMENFFARLHQNNRYYEAAAPAYLMTHPLTVERISDMENRTRKMGARLHEDSLDFLLIQQRLRVLQENKYDQWLRIARELKQELEHNVSERKKTAYYYGLSVVSRKLNQGADAKRYAELAMNTSREKTNAVLIKNLSEMRFLYGNAKEKQLALRAAKKLVEDNPLSQMAVKLYAGELYDLKRYQEVLRFMRNQEAMSTTNPSYHAIAARCYKELNQMSEHYQAVGDMYLAQGDKRAAEYQYNLAQKANDGDYYTMSQVDAKLRNTRAAILEDEKFRNQ